MKIEASTIEELIEKSGPHAGALRKLDPLIVAAAPELPRRVFSGPSITMLGYGNLIWQNMSSSGVWPVIAVAPQKHQISMYVAAEKDGVPLVQVGYWIGTPFWNHGYCTEASQAVIAFAFGALRLHRIVVQHLVRNPASGRVMHKLGMRPEGIHRDAVRKWDRFEDVAVHAILASEWAAGVPAVL